MRAPDTQAEWMDAMREARWDDAWAFSDQVLRARDAATRDDPRLPYHLRWVWDGAAPDGKHVLVRCYHGLGDTIQFARYLPALRARAASVTLEVQPALVELLAGAADRVVPFAQAVPLPPTSCDIEIMELGHALRLPPGAVGTPYVRVPASARGGIGLCWEAGGWDADRSVPFELMKTLLPQIRRPISLQLGRCTGFDNPGGCPATIEAAACLIAGLDLVIAVDTMVAHLAGALGRPCWLLLKHAADWRWGNAARTPWYPNLRLFRQAAPGDWTPVVAHVTARLKAVPG